VNVNWKKLAIGAVIIVVDFVMVFVFEGFITSNTYAQLAVLGLVFIGAGHVMTGLTEGPESRSVSKPRHREGH